MCQCIDFICYEILVKIYFRNGKEELELLEFYHFIVIDIERDSVMLCVYVHDTSLFAMTLCLFVHDTLL